MRLHLESQPPDPLQVIRFHRRYCVLPALCLVLTRFSLDTFQTFMTHGPCAEKGKGRWECLVLTGDQNIFPESVGSEAGQGALSDSARKALASQDVL